MGGLVTDKSVRSGSDLFIVDNADSEWNVLRYLTGWCRLSSGLDIASAYFEIGSLLALDGDWQKVDTIRFLMGDEVTKRTKAAIAQALTARLEESLEAQKVRDDFLDGHIAHFGLTEPGYGIFSTGLSVVVCSGLMKDTSSANLLRINSVA